MLTQSEAEFLIAIRKRFLRQRTISMQPGTDETCDLIGDDERERSLLHLCRGSLSISKLVFQTRAQVIVLMRLDFDGAPHTNPDGSKIHGTHIHIYREGYNNKWAFPLNPNDFQDPVTSYRHLLNSARTATSMTFLYFRIEGG